MFYERKLITDPSNRQINKSAEFYSPFFDERYFTMYHRNLKVKVMTFL